MTHRNTPGRDNVTSIGGTVQGAGRKGMSSPSTFTGALPTSLAHHTGYPTEVPGSGRGHYAPGAAFRSKVSFFGSGVDGAWFEGVCIGREAVEGTGTGSPEFIPHTLFTFNGQYGTSTGISGSVLASSTDRYADSLTIVADYTHDQSAQVVTNPANGIATIDFDAMGYTPIQFITTCTVPSGSTGTAAVNNNWVWSTM